MFCEKCGAKLDDTEKFCHVCGTPTDVDEDDSMPSDEVAQPQSTDGAFSGPSPGASSGSTGSFSSSGQHNPNPAPGNPAQTGSWQSFNTQQSQNSQQGYNPQQGVNPQQGFNPQQNFNPKGSPQMPPPSGMRPTISAKPVVSIKLLPLIGLGVVVVIAAIVMLFAGGKKEPVESVPSSGIDSVSVQKGNGNFGTSGSTSQDLTSAGNTSSGGSAYTGNLLSGGESIDLGDGLILTVKEAVWWDQDDHFQQDYEGGSWRYVKVNVSFENTSSQKLELPSARNFYIVYENEKPGFLGEWKGEANIRKEFGDVNRVNIPNTIYPNTSDTDYYDNLRYRSLGAGEVEKLYVLYQIPASTESIPVLYFDSTESAAADKAPLGAWRLSVSSVSSETVMEYPDPAAIAAEYSTYKRPKDNDCNEPFDILKATSDNKQIFQLDALAGGWVFFGREQDNEIYHRMNMRIDPLGGNKVRVTLDWYETYDYFGSETGEYEDESSIPDSVLEGTFENGKLVAEGDGNLNIEIFRDSQGGQDGYGYYTTKDGRKMMVGLTRPDNYRRRVYDSEAEIDPNPVYSHLADGDSTKGGSGSGSGKSSNGNGASSETSKSSSDTTLSSENSSSSGKSSSDSSSSGSSGSSNSNSSYGSSNTSDGSDKSESDKGRYSNLSSTDRPKMSEFKWWYDDGVLQNGIPEGVRWLNASEYQGSWKGFIVYDVEKKYNSYMEELVNFDVEVTTKGVTLTVDWYMSRIDGETVDEENMADSTFTGYEYGEGIYVTDAGNITIDNFYELDGKQYAIGHLTAQDGTEAEIAMMRP